MRGKLCHMSLLCSLNGSSGSSEVKGSNIPIPKSERCWLLKEHATSYQVDLYNTDSTNIGLISSGSIFPVKEPSSVRAKV